MSKTYIATPRMAESVATASETEVPKEQVAAPRNTQATQQARTVLSQALRTKDVARDNEVWLSMQERSFTEWINHMMGAARTQSEEGDEDDYFFFDRHEADAVVPVAPAEAEARVERARARAAEIWAAEAMRSLDDALGRDITRGKLALRSDKPLAQDVASREAFLDLIGSFHPTWLRLAVETVSGRRFSRADREAEVAGAPKGVATEPKGAIVAAVEPKAAVTKPISDV